jgi:hypothetical protein
MKFHLNILLFCIILLIISGLSTALSDTNSNIGIRSNKINDAESGELNNNINNYNMKKLKSNRRDINRHHGMGGNRKNKLNELLEGIFILPKSKKIEQITGPWSDILMPNKSYFAGFKPPTDLLLWNQAVLQASRGEQVLLSKVLDVIHNKDDFIKGSLEYEWIHELADYETHTERKNW